MVPFLEGRPDVYAPISIDVHFMYHMFLTKYQKNCDWLERVTFGVWLWCGSVILHHGNYYVWAIGLHVCSWSDNSQRFSHKSLCPGLPMVDPISFSSQKETQRLKLDSHFVAHVIQIGGFAVSIKMSGYGNYTCTVFREHKGNGRNLCTFWVYGGKINFWGLWVIFLLFYWSCLPFIASNISISNTIKIV